MDQIEEAKGIIGTNENDDFIIRPLTHAEQFAETAPELSAILNSSKIQSIAGEYERKDSQAILAQSEFKKWSGRAHWSFFITAIFSAGLLASETLSTLPIINRISANVLIAIFAFGSVVCGSFAAHCISRVRTGKLLEKWMLTRADAEMQRLDYFEKVVQEKNNDTAAINVPLSLLRFEFFRRFQLDSQLSFYDVRSKQHTSLANKALSLSSWSMWGVALVNGFAGVFGQLDSRLAAVAGLALVLQAFASKERNIEAVNQNSKNAESYEQCRSSLATLSGDLDEVRNGIADGKLDTLSFFVEAVHEQLSLEHRQWLKASKDRLSAIGKLEEHLKELKTQREEAELQA